MDFNVNSPILFIIVGLIIAVVLGQSVYFLVKALKRAKELGIDKKVVKKTITTSATFTIAPAISILVGVVTLSVALGIPLPWLRLSVVGSLSYETISAGQTLVALGKTLGSLDITAEEFVTVTIVMTVGIALGLIAVPLVTKKIQSGMIKLENKDKKWMEILNNAMFMGMISAFLGYVFCDITKVFYSQEQLNELAIKAMEKLAEKGVEIKEPIVYTNTQFLIPVLVFFVSAIVMVILGLLSKKTKQRWITDYALPISLILGMASAVPFTMWLG
ncbi:MAG: DUF5058 family protein [Clostridia bacterium]|nr:DUF5058 family protein [Clostridia bacterium]